MFTCKACQRVFEQDLKLLTPLDHCCPHCGNVYIAPAETQESLMFREAQEYIDAALERLLDPSHGFFSAIPGRPSEPHTSNFPR